MDHSKSLPDVCREYVFFRMENEPPFITAQNAGSWAHASVVERLPAILQKLQAPASVPVAFAGKDAAALSQEYTGLVSKSFCDSMSAILKEDGPIPLLKSGPSKERWNAIIEGSHSLTMPWLLLEAVFYRLIMDECQFFEKRLDPFRPQKLNALIESEAVIRHIAHLRAQYDLPTPEMIANLLNFSLWSNAVDLSRHPGGLSASFADSLFHGVLDKKSNILINDHNAFVELLQQLPQLSEHAKPSKDVTAIIIADNAGMEFISDLLLADVLITSNRFTKIEFHVKYHPTFVSDVTIADIEDTLVFVEKISPVLGHRWRHHFKTGAFVTLEHYYYNSYEPYWVIPLDLFVRYQNSALVISKGDANARRFHGDRAWEFSMPTQDIICYFPVPLMLVRTFKSETVSGIDKARIEEFVSTSTNDWYHSGDYGTIQLIKPKRPIRLSPITSRQPTHDDSCESLSASEETAPPQSGSAPTSLTSPLLLPSLSAEDNASRSSRGHLVKSPVFAEEGDDPLELEIREVAHDDDLHGHHQHKKIYGSRRSASQQNPMSHHHHHHHHHHAHHHHHHHHGQDGDHQHEHQHHHHGHRSGSSSSHPN